MPADLDFFPTLQGRPCITKGPLTWGSLVLQGPAWTSTTTHPEEEEKTFFLYVDDRVHAGPCTRSFLSYTSRSEALSAVQGPPLGGPGNTATPRLGPRARLSLSGVTSAHFSEHRLTPPRNGGDSEKARAVSRFP